MLNDVKDFLRIDTNDDDILLTSLITASEEYIKNSTRPDVNTTSELYKIALKLLVSHWYENREVVGKDAILPFSLNSILIQLSHLGV